MRGKGGDNESDEKDVRLRKRVGKEEERTRRVFIEEEEKRSEEKGF